MLTESVSSLVAVVSCLQLSLSESVVNAVQATCSVDGVVRIYEATDVMNLSIWNLQHEIQTRVVCSCLSWSTSKLDFTQHCVLLLTTYIHLFYSPLDFVWDHPVEPVPEPIWILLKQETVSGSGISWDICKAAPFPRQIQAFVLSCCEHYKCMHVHRVLKKTMTP